MATIHVDGKEYEVNGADNLLQAVFLWDLIFLTFAGTRRWEASVLAASARLSNTRTRKTLAVVW